MIIIGAKKFIQKVLYQYFNDPAFNQKIHKYTEKGQVNPVDTFIMACLKDQGLMKRAFEQQHKKWQASLKERINRLAATCHMQRSEHLITD